MLEEVTNKEEVPEESVADQIMWLVDKQIELGGKVLKLSEALRHVMEAVNLLRKEVQDGGQRSIKEQ